MTESTVKLPSKSVVLALFKKHGEVKEETSSIGGEWSAQVGRHVENGNLHRGAFNAASAIVRKGGNNELAALQHIDHLRVYLDWAEEMIRNRGHVGDLVKQAQESEKAEKQPEPSNAMPLDEAEKAFEASAHKAPTPAEVDAKASGKKRGLRSIKGGKEDVKAVADKHVAAQEERLGASEAGPALDDGFDELEPPAAPEKPKNPLEGATGTGTYTLN